MEKINITELSKAVHAYQSCLRSGNTEFTDKWEEKIDLICKNLPSGSGIDTGTKINLNECHENKLVFSFSFHHLNKNGYYDGWTDHKLIISPSLCWGYSMKITGRDRNMIKDYLYDIFRDVFIFDIK